MSHNTHTAASHCCCLHFNTKHTLLQQRSTVGHDTLAFAGSNSLYTGHSNLTPGSLIGVMLSQELGCMCVCVCVCGKKSTDSTQIQKMSVVTGTVVVTTATASCTQHRCKQCQLEATACFSCCCCCLGCFFCCCSLRMPPPASPHLAAAGVVAGHHIVNLLRIKLPVVCAGKLDAWLCDWQHVLTGGGLQRAKGIEARRRATNIGRRACACTVVLIVQCLIFLHDCYCCCCCKYSSTQPAHTHVPHSRRRVLVLS